MIASFCILIEHYPKIWIRLKVGTRPHLKVFLNGFQVFLKWHMQSLLHFSTILGFLTLSSRFSYSFFTKFTYKRLSLTTANPFRQLEYRTLPLKLLPLLPWLLEVSSNRDPELEPPGMEQVRRQSEKVSIVSLPFFVKKKKMNGRTEQWENSNQTETV